MIYEYYCIDCVQMHEIEKSYSQIDRREFCVDCASEMERRLSAKVSFSGEKVESEVPYFHPALGQVVSSDREAKRLAKEAGMIEIGNESQNTMAPKEKSYELTDREFHDTMGLGDID